MDGEVEEGGIEAADGEQTPFSRGESGSDGPWTNNAVSQPGQLACLLLSPPDRLSMTVMCELAFSTEYHCTGTRVGVFSISIQSNQEETEIPISIFLNAFV